MELELSDSNDLARDLQAHRMEAFDVLMQRYLDSVRKIAFQITRSHEDAEDVAQETFLTMLEKIEQWSGDHFEGWLFRIARNLSIDCLRKRRLVRTEKMEVASPRAEEIMGQEDRDTINAVLGRLPPVQRDILYWRHFQGASLKEIAARRKCAEGTVKATLFQIFQKLRKDFSEAGLME